MCITTDQGDTNPNSDPYPSATTKQDATVHIQLNNYSVWLGGAVVRALDLRLEVAGSIPAAALSSAILDKLFTHTVQRLSSYDLMALYKSA